MRLIAALFLAALPVEAVAQQVCMTYRRQADGRMYRQIDRETTFLFRQMQDRPDPRIRQIMTGTWQAQVPAPRLRMVSYQTSTYDANGLWSYANRTCGGPMNYCSNAQGHGAYVGVLNGNTINLAFIYSDLEVENACIRNVVQIVGAGMLRDSNGAVWRKVR